MRAGRAARAVAGLGSVQLGARIEGHGPRDLVPVVLFGYERAPRGLPDARARGPDGSTPTARCGPRASGEGSSHPARSRPVPRRGDRVPRRQPLLRSGHPVGLARHLARGAGRQPARARGWGRASCRRWWCDGAAATRRPGGRDRPGHRRRDLDADHRPGDRRAAGRVAAAERLQPDHRGHGRHRHGRGGAVLRPHHRRAHRRSTAC